MWGLYSMKIGMKIGVNELELRSGDGSVGIYTDATGADELRP